MSEFSESNDLGDPPIIFVPDMKCITKDGLLWADRAVVFCDAVAYFKMKRAIENEKDQTKITEVEFDDTPQDTV